MSVAKKVASVKASAADVRSRRSAQAQMYAPRVRPAPAPVALEDMRLRRITAQALDALRLPGAVPRRIVMDALVQAKALRS